MRHIKTTNEKLVPVQSDQFIYQRDGKILFDYDDDNRIILGTSYKKEIVFEAFVSGRNYGGAFARGWSDNFSKMFDAENLGRFSFFEIFDNDLNVLYTDLKFENISDLYSFLSAMPETIHVKFVRAYIKVGTETTVTTTGYNELYSRLRGRKHLLNTRKSFTQALDTDIYAESRKTINSFVRVIYRNEFGRELDDTELNDAILTVSCVGKMSKRFNLPSNALIGSRFGRYTEDDYRLVYNLSTDSFETILDASPVSRDLYLDYDSFFYYSADYGGKQNFDDDASILTSFSLSDYWNKNSWFKVGVLRSQNSRGEPVVAFRIYPMGIDSILISNPTPAFPDDVYDLYCHTKRTNDLGRYTLVAGDLRAIDAGYQRRLYRITGLELKRHIYNAEICKNKNAANEVEFSFVLYSRKTGLCYRTSSFKFNTTSAGNCCKITYM